MFAVLLLFLALSIVRGAGQNLTEGGPSGVIRGGTNTTVTTKNGKTVVNVNVTVIINGAGGLIPQGGPIPQGGLIPQGASRPPATTVNPTQGTGIPTSQPTESPPVSPAGKGPDPSGPPPSSPGTSFEQDGLNAHNYYRAYHDSPPMTLNNEMSSAAAAYAKKIASTGSMQHSSRDERPGQGENLYMSCTSKSTAESAATAVKKWYDEVCSPGYPFGSAQSPGGAGHFTQVVWSDSTELGIGKGTSQKGGMKCTYVVARYKPLGNFNTGNDDYNKNVKRGENFDEDKYCSGQKPSWFDAPLKQLGRPDSEKLQGFRLVEESRDINVSKKAKVLKKRPHPRQKIWRHKKVKTHV